MKNPPMLPACRPARRNLRCACLALLLMPAAAAVLIAGPEFRYLGDLPGGAEYSVANGISADGSFVVGGSASTASGGGGPLGPIVTEAFIWDAATGSMIGLGDLPGGEFASAATDVTADGKVAVGWSTEFGSGTLQGRSAPFRWVRGNPGVMSRMDGTYVNAIYGSAVAAATTSTGSLTVGIANWQDDITFELFSRGFRYQLGKAGAPGVPVWINNLPAQSTATAISPNGQHIVGMLSQTSGSPSRAYRKTDAQPPFDIGLAGNALTRPMGVSNDGKTIIGSYFPGGGITKIFRWTEAGLPQFTTLRESGAAAVGLSADGHVALDAAGGLYLDAQGPFDLREILAAAGVIDLRALPAGSFEAKAISDNGLCFAGRAFADGRQRAWRVKFSDCDGNSIPDELERLAVYSNLALGLAAAGSERFASQRDAVGYGTMITEYGVPWKPGTGRVPQRSGAAAAELLRVLQRIPDCADSSFLDSPGSLQRFYLGATLPALGELFAYEMLLGNEAFSDAMDPTIGLAGIPSADLGSQFAFKGAQGIGDLLDEELALLRGRELAGAPADWVNEVNYFPEYTSIAGEKVRAAIYNRLPPNAAGLGVAYRSAYDVADNYEAALKFPQGHGDAYGHYLSSVKFTLDLFKGGLRGAPEETADALLDLLLDGDEPLEAVAGLAAAGAARARAASGIADLLFRRDFRENSEDPRVEELYRDANPDRAWSMGDWARRGAIGAYLDWAAASQLAPTDEARAVHRSALPELDEIAATSAALQERLDAAGAGLDPLGLVQNVVPFGIDASGLEPGSGKSHYEQVRTAASQAIDNARKALENANQAGQRLRESSSSLDAFTDQMEDLEADYDQQLTEIFGFPSQDDPSDNDLDPATTDFQESQLHADLTGFFYSDDDIAGLEWRPRPAPGEVQLAFSELKVAAMRIEKAELALDDLRAQIQSQMERIELLASIQWERIEIIVQSCNDELALTDRLQQIEEEKKAAGIGLGFVKTVIDLATNPAAAIDDIAELANSSVEFAYINDEFDVERERTRVQCYKEMDLQGLEDILAIDAERRELKALLRQTPQLLLDLAETKEVASQALGRFRQAMEKGRMVLRQKNRHEARARGGLVAERWKDMSFRVFRNASLKNYRAFFDLAARYVVLAARAYAYEFNARSDGENVLSGIHRERRIGDAAGGGGGLQGVLARLDASVTVNNFNRPLETLGEVTFNFRRNLMGFGNSFPDDDLRFRAWLEGSIIDRVEDLSEVRELAQLSVQRDYGPAIVVPFATEIDSRNFFGRGPELPYGNTNFSITRNAKIRSYAIRLDGVDTSLGIDPVNGTVFVYLLPVGDSVLRENTNQPRIEDEVAAPWAVVDQFLPPPPQALSSDLSRRTYNPWRSTAQSGGNFLNEIKRYLDSTAQVELGQRDLRYNTLLAGRSAWNTRWLFILPGSQWTSSSDPAVIRRKLLQLIYGNNANPAENLGINDIRLIIQAYSH